MAIAEAFRVEIQRVLAEGELTIKTCAKLERLVKASKAFLQAMGGVPATIGRLGETVDGDDEPTVMDLSSDGQLGVMVTPTSALSGAPASETFGVRLIQELLAALPGITRPPAAAPAPVAPSMGELVRAIKEARDLGLHDVATAMEAQLYAMLPPPPAQPPPFAPPAFELGGPTSTAAPESPVPESSTGKETSDPLDRMTEMQAQPTRKLSDYEVRRLQEIRFGASGEAVDGVVMTSAVAPPTIRHNGVPVVERHVADPFPSPFEHDQSGEVRVTRVAAPARSE